MKASSMSLPVSVPSERSALASAAVLRPLAGMRTLVIASQGWSQRTVIEILRGLGAEHVDTVHDAASAEIQLELAIPHLVISAAHLSDGTEAVDLIPRLRRSKKLPLSSAVVVVGRERDAKSITALAEACADLVLIWPFETEDISQRVTGLMDRRRALFAVYQAIDDNDLDVALDEAKSAVSRAPRLESEAWRVVSDALLRAGRLDEAITIAQRVSKDSGRSWAILRQAQVLTAKEKYDQAAALLEAVTRAQPNLIGAQDALADLRSIQGDWKGALESASLANGQASTVLSRQKRFGLLCVRQGQWTEAEQALILVSNANHGTDIEVETGLLVTYLNVKKDIAAKARLGQILRVYAQMPEAQWSQHLDSYTRSSLRRQFDLARTQVEQMSKLAEAHAGEMNLELILETVQLCTSHGLRQEGFAAALALTRARRANRIELHRLRRLIDGLGTIPPGLIGRAVLELSWQRLSDLAGSADQSLSSLREQIMMSLDWWRARYPQDPELQRLSLKFQPIRAGLPA